MRILPLLMLVVLASSATGAQTPDSVFYEDFTWMELKEKIENGWTTIIIATGGTEQNGPHMILGKHNYILRHTTDKIARILGKTFVAPIIAHVPEGDPAKPTGHMTKAGTISLPNEYFVELVSQVARSLKATGFRDVILLGDSGGNQQGMLAVAERLNAEWKSTGHRAHFIGDYYAKSSQDADKWLMETFKETAESIGTHAGINDTSQLMAINPSWIRQNKLAKNGGPEGSDATGVRGDPTRASAERGQMLLKIKIDNALAQIRKIMAAASDATRPVTTLTPTRTAGQRPDSVAMPGPQDPADIFLEDMTWTEVRDAVAQGTNVVIIPIGGMEQNGPHMVVGKHNFVVQFAANLMARRLGNALVAPVVSYDPQGSADTGNFTDQPGKITAATVYEKVLEFSARSLKVHGFRDIVFIGDSGSNQRGMTAVANLLNKEWEGGGARVLPITAYYSVGREHYRAYLLAQYGWDDATVGSHAGISDTSQMLYVHPQGIRKNKLMPRGGGPNSGVSGDPTKASSEIGKLGIEFKVNAAIEQYRQLKTAPRGGRGGD